MHMTQNADDTPWISIEDGDEIRGSLHQDDIALALDALPELLVYDNRKNVLPGYHTALTETESCDALERVWMRDSRMIGYCVYNKEEGIYIRNVSSGRPASVAGFQVGDWVEGIDGRKIAKSDEVWAERDKITDGSRQHLLMELRRGAKTHWYILTK